MCPSIEVFKSRKLRSYNSGIIGFYKCLFRWQCQEIWHPWLVKWKKCKMLLRDLFDNMFTVFTCFVQIHWEQTIISPRSPGWYFGSIWELFPLLFADIWRPVRPDSGVQFVLTPNRRLKGQAEWEKTKKWQQTHFCRAVCRQELNSKLCVLMNRYVKLSHVFKLLRCR